MSETLEVERLTIAGLKDVEAGIEALCALDPRLAAVVAKAGPIPLRRREPGYAGLARVIVGQMVSRASADAIWARLEAETAGVTALACRTLDDAACRRIGLSRAKEAALLEAAGAEIDDGLDLHAVCALPAEEAIARLTAIRGIGAWTAQVYLLFCAGHPDVFPSGDVALQNAVAHAFSLDGRPAPRTLAAIAAQWAPWRAVAARLFWAYYARELKRSVLPIG